MANCFFATKVSFMNEMYQVCEAINGDWDAALEGFITDGRIGNSHIDVPGHDGDFGFGGKCFPKDLNAMIKKAEDSGQLTKGIRIIEATAGNTGIALALVASQKGYEITGRVFPKF